MKINNIQSTCLVATLMLAASIQANASIIISEVHPTGSSATTTYAADWFELTNTGTSAVDITGWKMDDNSNNAVAGQAVSLRGITSIDAGKSVVFLETDATGTTDTAKDASFKSAWFGSNVPTGFLIGNYGGSGVSLGAGGDAVNIYNSTGLLQANVMFGAATVGTSFNNAAGLNNTTISTLSVVGTNGAFTSVTGSEIGSPSAVPVPAAVWLFSTGLIGLTGFARKRKAV